MPEGAGQIAFGIGRPASAGRVAGLLPALAALLLALLLAVSFAFPAAAQSSVRPPEASVEVAPPGPDLRGGVLGNRSRSEVWHDIRLGAAGNVTIPDPNAAIMIQSQGEDWRLLRREYVIPYGGRILLGICAAIGLFFALRGRIRIHGGRTGRVIPRFSLVERVVHWFTAVLFVLLGLSGLILLFGRDVLLPVIGPTLFGIIASASMQGHNLFGPIFLVSILALFITFARGNGYRLVDILWALKGGGLLGGHASSGRYNFGEKSWFWCATFCGLAISVTGFLMLFPDHLPAYLANASSDVPPERTLLQWANLIHAAAAIVFIGFALGHIYLGTIGMEGALEGMTRGTVDENWAKSHHDLWYDEHAAAATTDNVRAEVKAAAGNV